MSKLFKVPPFVFPIAFVIVYVAFIIFVRKQIPQSSEFIKTLQELYLVYGYFLVFFGGLLEGTFLVGFYVPGSTVVLLGAAMSRTGILSLPLVLLIGTISLTCAYAINYCLGRFGWYHIFSQFGLSEELELAKENIRKHTIKSFLIGYIAPGGASFVSTAAGIIKMPFGKFLFLSFASQSLWSMVWGSLAYYVGLSLVEFLMKNFIFAVLILAALYLFRKYGLKKLRS